MTDRSGNDNEGYLSPLFYLELVTDFIVPLESPSRLDAPKDPKTILPSEEENEGQYRPIILSQVIR